MPHEIHQIILAACYLILLSVLIGFVIWIDWRMGKSRRNKKQASKPIAPPRKKKNPVQTAQQPTEEEILKTIAASYQKLQQIRNRKN